MDKRYKWYIILSVVLLSVVMNCVDGVIKPPYAVKSAVKVILFLGVPVLYFWRNKAGLKQMLTLKKTATAFALLLGAICFAVIVGGYFVLRGVVDFSNITKSLTADSGITAKNFVYVALYISFCNSFLEEFFFRGFAFLTLKQYTDKRFAYLFSAFLFAFYHTGMTIGWVHPAVFGVELIGLLAAGIVLNYLNEKSKTLYPSWLMHMFCNFGINTVGILLFKM